MKKTWTLNSWEKFIAKQQPEWINNDDYLNVISEIKNYPPLVFAGEVRSLKKQLADAANGDGFLIHLTGLSKSWLMSLELINLIYYLIQV